MKKKIVIVFPDEWVSYSPTILNLVSLLKFNYDVVVIGFDSSNYKNHMLDNKIYKLYTIPKTFYKVINKFRLLNIVKLLYLIYKLRREKADIVIGVDDIGCLASQIGFGNCYFLSLEIRKSFLFKLINKKKINLLIIQSEVRKEYLFSECIIKTVYLQNAPIFRSDLKSYKNTSRQVKKLIFFGNICPEHGIYQCIEAVKQLEDVQLLFKGIITKEVQIILFNKYKELFNDGRIYLDDNYLDQEDVTLYLADFDIGFCFYDFNLISSNNFNYLSCPSGKLFNYYAAGVPVIASDIVGLKSVRDFDAGVLIKDHSPQSIKKAIEKILENHNFYSENCTKAAKHFDFLKGYNNFVKEI